jgi:CRP-like cAMP-binding protein
LEKYLFILKGCPFFSGMTDDEILTILHCMDARVKKIDRNAYIFRSGESTETMGLVMSGSVLVIQEDLWGHRNILAKIIPGDFFGESYAATPGSVLNVSVVADEDSEIMLLNMERFLKTCPHACAHHGRMVRNLVSVMAKRVLDLNEKLTHMAKRSTREKLLSYLSAESMRQGKLAFTIPYDRQALADYLGVERSAMSAELGKMKREGLLDFHKNQFRFLK